MESIGDSFSWIPGKGPDPSALERMEQHFRRPRVAMGEAWFMSHERRRFTVLMDRDPAEIPALDVNTILIEITSGTSCFGPKEEWRSWFHDLLPRLIPRAFERLGLFHLVEPLISGFVANHPQAIVDAYPGFREDVLSTLALSIMSPDFWSDGSIRVSKVLCPRPNKPGLPWGWYAPSGDLSALMFFCVKYLDPSCLDGWVKSIVSIRDPHWGTQVLAWLVAFYRLLDAGIDQPAQFDGVEPDPSWEASHCLTGNYTDEYSHPIRIPFLRQQSVDGFLAAVRHHVDEDLVLRWAASFTKFPYLETEAWATPDQFLLLHGTRKA